MSLFDHMLEDEESLALKAKPFHTVMEKPEKELLEWYREVSSTLQKSQSKTHQLMKSNLAAYRGIDYRGPASRSTYRQTERIPTNRLERFVVNHLHDMTETKVAQLTRLKPVVDVLPATDEWEDKNAAKATKALINHLWYINDIDFLLQRISRQKKIFGEAFLFITWDKFKGDKHPEAGDEIQEEDGEIRKVPANLKIGDVKYDIEVPWRVLLDPVDDFCKAEYCFRITIDHIEKLKSKYPDQKDKIKADSDTQMFDTASLETRKLIDQAIVFEFWHKKTELVPEGRYAKFTRTTILEDGDHNYNHGCFPFERITDLDIPHVLHGVSQYEMVKPIQNMHNNLSTLLAKNIWLTGHAKWVMPKGACKIEALGNDNTIVQYQGPVPPQLLQVQPNPPEAYGFRDKLKEEMEQIYAVHGISRGQPPQGVTAAVALQFLNEQESERASSEISKHNTLIRCIAKKTLAVAGDYYETDDDRMLNILGKDQRYLVKHFDASNLTSSYDIRVKNGNALAESKAGRTQRIIELVQYKPEALSAERIVDLLDLGQVDKMTTLMTEAIRSAESENEDMLESVEVDEPREWEDHILHWRTHVKMMQARSFKEETPIEVREKHKHHVMITEFLMTEKAKVNPLFQAKVAELDLFPIFYREGMPMKSRAQQEAEVQGQSNRGEAVTGAIPADEPQILPGEQVNTGDKQ